MPDPKLTAVPDTSPIPKPPIFTPGQEAAIGAVVRSLLLIAFASLTQRKLVDGAVLGIAVNELAQQAVGWLGAALVIGWSLLQKLAASRKIATALVMPTNATDADLAAVVKKTSPGLIPTGPLPTVHEAAVIVAEEKKS